MRAVDVMTSDVITVTLDTSVHALPALLSERGISGVPVVGARRIEEHVVAPPPGSAGEQS
jgi:CBS domain-containing protein